MLCDHKLSAAPSSANQRWCRMFISVGVLRSTIAWPLLRFTPSVQLYSAIWQVPHETFSLTDNFSSKNSRSPRSTAWVLPETRLLTSGFHAIGHGPWLRIWLISALVNSITPGSFACVTPATHDTNTPIASKAANSIFFNLFIAAPRWLSCVPARRRYHRCAPRKYTPIGPACETSALRRDIFHRRCW